MYRTIDTSTWTDPKVRKLQPLGKLLFVYLITNSHAHVSGIYYLPRAVVALETGIEAAFVDTLCDTLSGLGLVRNDQELDVFWVVNMLAYQAKGEKADRAAALQLETLHNTLLIPDFLKRYPSVKRYFKHRVSHRVSRVGIQEQDQEQDQEQENTSSPTRPATETLGIPSDCASDKAPNKPAIRKERPRDELFDAIVTITGSDPKVSGSNIGRVCKLLRSAEPPYTPAEVLSLPDAIARAGMSFTITVNAIEKHIGLVRNQPAQPPPRGKPADNGRTQSEFFSGNQEFQKRHEHDPH